MQESRRPVDLKILRQILHAIGDLPKAIYAPSDDTFLMLDAISNLQFQGREVLDLGTGSGILGLYAAMNRASVTVTDVDESAIDHIVKAAKSLRINLKPLVSDLFSNVEGDFDVVLFNPPYVPSNDVVDRAIDGGRKGSMAIRRFLDDLPRHLRKNGSAFLVVSSRNDPASLAAEHPEFHFSLEKKLALFFEELQVLRLTL